MGETRSSRALAAAFILAILAGCAGVPSPSPPTAEHTLSGTAARGASLAGATIVVKDHAGATREAKTDAAGHYSVDVAGLTPPFLVEARATDGTVLFSTGSAVGVANVHPFTDLIVGTWYDTQGLNVTSVFDSLGPSTPVPTKAEVDTISAVVTRILDTWMAKQGVDPAKFDPFTTPFEANGKGFDAVLDAASVDARHDITVQSEGTTQRASISNATSGTGLDVRETLTSATGRTEHADTAFVGAASAPADVTQAIQATLDTIVAVAREKGAALSGDDLTAVFAGERDHTAAASELASKIRDDAPTSASVKEILSYDGKSAFARIALARSQGEANVCLLFIQSRGAWRLVHDPPECPSAPGTSQDRTGNASGPSPDQDPVHYPLFEARVERTTGSGPGENRTELLLWIEMDPPEHVIRAMNVTGGPWKDQAIEKQPQLTTTSAGRHEVWTIREPVDAYPPAGTPFAITIVPETGAPWTHQVKLRTTTTDLVRYTNLHDTSLAAAHLGGKLDLEWQLPTTFTVENVNVGAALFTDSGATCAEPSPSLSATTIRQTIDMMTTCEGAPVTMASVCLLAKGTQGESSMDCWHFGGVHREGSTSPGNGSSGGAAPTLWRVSFDPPLAMSGCTASPSFQTTNVNVQPDGRVHDASDPLTFDGAITNGAWSIDLSCTAHADIKGHFDASSSGAGASGTYHWGSATGNVLLARS